MRRCRSVGIPDVARAMNKNEADESFVLEALAKNDAGKIWVMSTVDDTMVKSMMG